MKSEINESEVFETHYFLFIVSLCTLLFLAILTSVLLWSTTMFFFVIFLIICILGSVTLQKYSRLWIKVIISDERIEILKPFGSIKLNWSKFSTIKIFTEGPKKRWEQSGPYSMKKKMYYKIDFKISFYRYERFVKSVSFKFENMSKGRKVFSLIKNFSQKMNKELHSQGYC